MEYGTTTEYGQTTAHTPVAETEGEQSETLTLSGLEPCTTYHYQAEAENESNEGQPSLGGDQTFETECKGTAKIKVSLVHRRDSYQETTLRFSEQLRAEAGVFLPTRCQQNLEFGGGTCAEIEVVSVSREIPEGYRTTDTIVPSAAATKVGATGETGYNGCLFIGVEFTEKSVIEEHPLESGSEIVRDSYEFEIEWVRTKE
jgi:hypothetical protein